MENGSLKDLSDKIKIAQQQNCEPLNANKKKQDASNNSTAGLGVGLKIGADLIAGVLVGLMIGYYIDLYFGTKPLFLLLFLLIGFVSGVLNVYRTATKMEQENKMKKGLK